MNEREVECSRCDNTTIMTQDDIPSGWVFVETGWDIIDKLYLCPDCKKRYLKHQMIIEENKRKYPNLVMYPSE